MHLQLKPETEQFIDEQVKSGRYESPEALIEAVLSDYQDLALDDDAIAAINEGLEQADRGEGIELDVVRARFSKRT